MKKLLLGILLSTSLFSQDFIFNFFKYSTAYASFSLNAPRYQEDRFRITGGLDTGELEVERDEREFQPDFQKAFGIRKIGRFKYEPKRGVKNAGVGGTWYDGSENNTNEGANIGVVKGWEYLVKFTEGRQWGNDYLNQEYWLRYTGDWWVMKYGYTQLGLEDVEYMQGDLRLKYTPDLLNVFGNSFDEVTFSIGLKHRQHPVYGFDAMVLDTSWYRGSWWDFAEDAFGWDDNRWYIVQEGFDIQNGQLVYYDAESGSYISVPGDGPFFNGNGEFIGYDYFWLNEAGDIIAWTDREFFIYYFPGLLEGYIEDFKSNLGYQRETSIVLGIDMYHYADNWWFHSWVNWLPYHYGHDSYSYHNAVHYQEQLDKGMEPYNFMYMEPMWMAWDDFDFGSIVGVKLMDNVGIFAEGSYLYYWGRPAYNFKFGLNYQFLGFANAK